MAKKDNKGTLRGSQLSAAVAETVFGWRDVQSRNGELVGKKPDKLGRLRTAKVPDYAGDQSQAYAIDERMKQLGQSAAYLKELARITETNKLPLDWATAEQRSRAAIGALAHKRKKK
ncbi:MAG TPA: hypothetical protein VJQ55_00700 [Candidatus Binatia bacterium]|nr:hypothetical protein [Candidatus Binatia bacterium]